MSSPLPNDVAPPVDGLSAIGANDRDRIRLARKWAYLISTTAYIPLPYPEIERELVELTRLAFRTVIGEPFDPDPAAEIGTRLVDLNCAGPLSLRRTIEILGKGLLGSAELRSVDRLDERIVGTLSALTWGHQEASHASLLSQQENLNQALLHAVQNARRQARASEARFDEVFTSSTSGIAITGLDGRFTRTNQAFDKILDRTPDEFDQLTLFDIVSSTDEPRLRSACQDLLDGSAKRLRRRPLLVRRDDETVRGSLSVSLLPDADGRPSRYLVIIEDDTELTLLQGQLTRQSLHDPLTGLPNRQFFTTRMESMLGRADPTAGTTLYHLDLDAFSLITNGLGRQAGDHLLKRVAERLKAVMAEENAIVARFEGDEFAILVENSPTTPDIATTIGRINEELSEPVYVRGQCLVTSASIGVLHRPPKDADPTELLRASDMTLRRTKDNGRRQWGLFDRNRDTLDRQTYALAVAMPGAWQNSEVGVVFQPLVRLTDGRTTGLEGLLRWEHQRLGPIRNARCVALAEATGLILPLGNWLLRPVCEQIVRWSPPSGKPDLPLGVALTSSQSGDSDLVGAVLNILRETALPPDRLHLGLPTATLAADRGDAVDNLRVLADSGVRIVLHDFGATPGELACLEDLPVHTVRIAPRLTERQNRADGPGPLFTRSMAELIELAHLADATVVVDGIRTAEQADWWRRIGADIGQGEHFGPGQSLAGLTACW